MTPQEAIDAISLVETTDQEARIQIATILEQVQPAAGITLTPEEAYWLAPQARNGEGLARTFGPGATGGHSVEWFRTLAERLEESSA